MEYTAIIIDDEPKLREVLSIKLNNHCPNIKILHKAINAVDGYQSIRDHSPQIVFLDISMPGETGFEMLTRFDKIDFEIIFVTGYNEYGLDALKVSAVDYLLKPVKTEDMINAVQKAIARIEDNEKLNKYENLKHNINQNGDQKTKIAIPGSTSYQFVSIETIIRCEGWQKYTKIHTDSGECIVSSYNLGMFADMLLKYDFFASHKSHLVNTNHIKSYLKEGIIVMSDQSNVPVSRRRRDEFMDAFIRLGS